MGEEEKKESDSVEPLESQGADGELINGEPTGNDAAADFSAHEDEDGAQQDVDDPLRVELEQALSNVEKHRDEALRALAELDNVRKRAERDVEAAHKFGMEKFINELLPVKDSMDLGFDAANSADDVDALREGMALTLKMFDGALEKGGVTAIDPVGENFDPEFHQAMMMEESVEAEPGKILRVMQKGYSLNERLIRPAMVVVAKKAASE